MQESVDSKRTRIKPELDITQEIRDHLPEQTQAVKSVDMMQQVEAYKQQVQANLQAALDKAEDLTKNNEFEEPTLTKETGPTRVPDWSRFNIHISLRNLRPWSAKVSTDELRKLHLRW